MLKKLAVSFYLLGFASTSVCQCANSKDSDSKSSFENYGYVNKEELDDSKNNEVTSEFVCENEETKFTSKKIAIAASVAGFTAVLLTFYIIKELKKSKSETDINKTLGNETVIQSVDGHEDSTSQKNEEKETGGDDEKKNSEEKHNADIDTSTSQSTEKNSDTNEINVEQDTDIMPYGIYLDPTLYLLFKIPVLERYGFLSTLKEFWTSKKGSFFQVLKLALMIYLYLRLIIGAVCPLYHAFVLIVMFFTKIFQGICRWSDLLEHAKAFFITTLLDCAPIISSIIGGTCDRIVPLTFDVGANDVGAKVKVEVNEKVDKALGAILGYNARFLNRVARMPSFTDGPGY